MNKEQQDRENRERQIAYEREKQLAYEREKRKKRQEKFFALLVIICIVLLIFGLGVVFGWHLGEDSTVTVIVEPTHTVHKPTDLIISGDNALSPELQKVMSEKCEEYGVPYALALAVADQESRFDPDAVSRTNDHGLMQINSINFKWLREKGIDPLTYEGNIEAGVLMLSDALTRYGDVELALMAYNCGDTGAEKLWDAGTYSTKYSREVMECYKKWAQIVEGK